MSFKPIFQVHFQIDILCQVKKQTNVYLHHEKAEILIWSDVLQEKP